MIVRIEGILESIEGQTALLQMPGGFCYEVLVSAYTAARLGGSLGKTVRFHTIHYLESQNQGASMYPRLAGFLTEEDLRFFDLFTTTKGIGNKKALRALALASDQIAAAIADRDIAMLQSLPEIGRRTAETIIATLHGKVDGFLSPTPATPPAKSADKPGATETPTPGRGLVREALEVLLQLGENRVQAVQWIDQVMRDEKDKPGDVQTLIARVYRLKSNA